MLLPQRKEREYRFRLALRMVLPIFALVLALIFHTFITSHKSLSSSFYLEAILILVFSTYFIFFLIYKGFDRKITDSVSKTFTRDYLHSYLKKEIKSNSEYTLILISIDNLTSINKRYGIKTGDKVLFQTTIWIESYLGSKEVKNFPIGHIKGGDFVIGLKGSKIEYKTVLELMCLKSDELKIDDIEIQISGAINDTTLSKDLNYLIENLFELQSKNRSSKHIASIDNEMNPSELESHVISAIDRRDIAVMTQNIFEQDRVELKECFVKLKTIDGKVLHQRAYMKVLDKLRLMVDYDLMVLEECISKCGDTQENKLILSISPTSIRNPIFQNRVKELIGMNEYLKDRIIFLLSEIEYYPRVEKYNKTLQMFRSMGIKIAIDRLGSIHTSFLYLRDLDIDIVRFDSFYTKDISNSKSKSIVDGYNKMAHQNGIKTWIKMVESEDSKIIAKELGIDYLQGKYLAELEKINYIGEQK